MEEMEKGMRSNIAKKMGTIVEDKREKERGKGKGKRGQATF